MSFVIKLKKDVVLKDIRITVNNIITHSAGINDSYVNINSENCKEYFTNDKFFYFIGDAIFPVTDKHIISFLNTFDETGLKRIKGFFYILIYDKKTFELCVFNSLFSILPIYYRCLNDIIIISSDLKKLQNAIGEKPDICKQFLLERVLFNYSLLNNTIYNGVKIVDSNSYIKVSNVFSIIRHTDLLEYTVLSPHKFKPSIDRLTDLFIGNAKKYIPEDPFYISLTGGFDSRIILSVVLNNTNQNFHTYSYGDRTMTDIDIAENISKTLGLDYIPYYIDETYSEKKFLHYASDFISLNSVNCSITRSHYAWLADEISKKSRYLMSGIFGSEVLRPVADSGVMFPELIFDIFSDISDSALVKRIKNAHGLIYLKKSFVESEINELCEQILSYRKNKVSGGVNNIPFNCFVFEEIFRKYFGPEVITQRHYGLNNRAPFLDFDFLEELFKTEVSPFYNKFRDNSILARYKGQVLYAKILKTQNSPLGGMLLDRNYPPDNLLSISGRISILKNYMLKSYFTKPPLNQAFPDYNLRNLLINKEYFITLSQDNEFFDGKIIDSAISPVYDEHLFHAISMLMFIKKIE